MKKRSVFWGFLLVGIVSILFAITAVIANHMGAKSEVLKYAGRPTSSILPMCYRVSEKLPAEWKNHLKSSVMYLNQVAGQISAPPFFAAEKSCGQTHCTYNPHCRRDRVKNVLIRPAPLSYLTSKCAPLLRNDPSYGYIRRTSLAYSDLTNYRITICTDKVDQAFSLAFQDDDAARAIRSIGGHKIHTKDAILRAKLALFIAPQYVDYDCGLLCRKLVYGRFSETELEILKRIVPKQVQR